MERLLSLNEAQWHWQIPTNKSKILADIIYNIKGKQFVNCFSPQWSPVTIVKTHEGWSLQNHQQKTMTYTHPKRHTRILMQTKPSNRGPKYVNFLVHHTSIILGVGIQGKDWSLRCVSLYRIWIKNNQLINYNIWCTTLEW